MTWNAVILGSGSEAVNLALALMRPGFSTILIEPDPHAAARVLFFLDRMRHGTVPGVNTPTMSDTNKAISAADIVFDAPGEDMGRRPDELARTLRDLPGRALIATTNLPDFPRDIAPSRVVGLHLFAPAQIRRLVEITPGPDTVPATLKAASDLAREMGRVPVPSVMARASIGTRLLRRLYEVAEILLLQGAIPHELDEALVAFGFDMGLFEAQDLIGLDVAYGDRQRTRRPSALYDRVVQEGRLGKTAGVGWYRYPGGGGAVIDPLIEDLICEEARYAKVEPQEPSAADMQNQLVQALIDEGMMMLADGTAGNAQEIDKVSIHGLGFPSALGGVMRFGSQPQGRARN